MAVRKKPYDLLMLMTLEFLLLVLTFYTAAILVLLTALPSDADLYANIGPGASQFLIDNARDVTLYLGILFSFLTVVAGLLVWGFLRHKRWSYQVGIESSIILMVANLITIYLFGFDDLQFALRLTLSVVLPLIVIYYIRKPEIKKYLLG